ncbi:MAG: twin-arginine translocase subunit TatC [Nocardioides sp.]
MLLNLAGVVSGAWLGAHRSWIIISVFVFAAIATPSTDPFTMCFMAIPMVALFRGVEVIARVTDRAGPRGAPTSSAVTRPRPDDSARPTRGHRIGGPLDLPDWLGSDLVTWHSASGVAGSHLVPRPAQRRHARQGPAVRPRGRGRGLPSPRRRRRRPHPGPSGLAARSGAAAGGHGSAHPGRSRARLRPGPGDGGARAAGPRRGRSAGQLLGAPAPGRGCTRPRADRPAGSRPPRTTTLASCPAAPARSRSSSIRHPARAVAPAREPRRCGAFATRVRRTRPRRTRRRRGARPGQGPGGRRRRRLVVAGGDGLVHLAVQAVAGSGVPLGIIPAGSGNDVARYLDLPRSDPPEPRTSSSRRGLAPSTWPVVTAGTSSPSWPPASTPS